MMYVYNVYMYKNANKFGGPFFDGTCGTLDFPQRTRLHLHMAARTNRPLHSARDRERIQTSQLLNRLEKCALHELELRSDQLKSIEILLNKSMPNLASVESFNQTEVSVISAEPMSPEAWAEAHGATADVGETRQ